MSVKQEDEEVWGFSFSEVLGAVTGLVFVVVVAHIELRSELAGQQVTYLEWFFFVMYGALQFVVIDAYITAAKWHPWWIAVGKNLLPKVLYWPVLLGALWVISMVFFY